MQKTLELPKSCEPVVEYIPQRIEVQLLRTGPKLPKRKITSSEDCSKLVRPLYPSITHRESFYLVALHRDNSVIGVYRVSEGGRAQTIVDPVIIAQSLITLNASAFIISHNHPSGNLKPSQADLSVTDKIKDSMKLFDVTLLDHIIVTEESYYSMADNGLV